MKIEKKNQSRMKVILNGEPKECPKGTTIEKLLDLYKIDKNRAAVELNLQIVPRKELSNRMLKDADVLEVVTFVGGG